MSIANNFNHIRERINTACRVSGRDPKDVSILGAAKSAGPDKIREACEAGLMLVGENRIQEALPKMDALKDTDIEWHFIGRLQKNKAQHAASRFNTIQSVDTLSLAERLERVCDQLECTVNVFAEINVGGEVLKGGISPRDAEALCAAVADMDHLTLTGLMTVPPYHPDPENARPYFKEVKILFDDLSGKFSSLVQLSMGMSEDFEVAVQEGSTMVRLGRILFGERG